MISMERELQTDLSKYMSFASMVTDSYSARHEGGSRLQQGLVERLLLFLVFLDD